MSEIRLSIFYFTDNEIHHRAQMYVYLRELGVEPPAFGTRTLVLSDFESLQVNIYYISDSHLLAAMINSNESLHCTN